MILTLYSIIAITFTDITPSDEWNFVFGQARIMERMGVFSFARYDPVFEMNNDEMEYYLSKLQVQQQKQKGAVQTKPCFSVEDMPLFKRCLQVCCHEIAHLFAIKHCIYYK